MYHKMYCLAKFCRLCLSHGDLIHYGTRDKNNIRIYRKIMILFPQLINKQPHHFPIWICVKCQEQVNQSYEFKQKCYQSYKLLKKYSVQLYAANKGKRIPDVPAEIFQEVKPIIDKNVILIDNDDQPEAYSNADDITIVKHELLPSNLKSEPEFNKMLQSIIDSNFETIRQIDKANDSLIMKPNLNCSNTDERITVEPTISEEAQIVQNLEGPCISDVNPTVLTLDTNANDSVSYTLNENNNSIIPVKKNFAFDYTNDCFEQFATQANVTVASNAVTEICANNHLVDNALNTSTRVLRRRKSICYKTMNKTSLDDDIQSDIRVIEEVKSISILPAKKQIYKETTLTNEKTQNKKHKKLNYREQLKKNTKYLQELEVNKKKEKKLKKKCWLYFCGKCSKQYVIYARFLLHVNQCEGIIEPQCNICNKAFATLRSLKYHKKVHLRAKSVMSCDLCEIQFADQSSLRQHRREKHAFNIQSSIDFNY